MNVRALALSACALGCSPRPVTPAASASRVVTLPPTTVEGTPAPDGSSDADRAIAAALADTSRVRNLAPLAKVRGVVVTREAMGAHVKESIDREVPPEVVAAQGELLIALGLARPDFDEVAALRELLTSELAGYYEPTEKTMYLASDLGKDARDATLAHELVHALQDQHYDLGKLLDYRPDESDAQTAVHAFAEGDATSAMLDHMLEARGAHATDLSDELIGVQVRAGAQFSASKVDVPEILKRSLVAPYVDGIALVHFLRRRGGWDAVDEIWREPPTSTEQLLHPEKLLAREAALIVPPPVPPPGGPEHAELTDVLGEQSLRLLFEEWMPRTTAVASAAGWGGDRIGVFRAGDRAAVALHLVADSEQAATAQVGAFARGVLAAGGAALRDRTACAERAGLGPLLVLGRGRDVVLVAGPYRHEGSTVATVSNCGAARRWASSVLTLGK